jgi:hypothetical protein
MKKIVILGVICLFVGVSFQSVYANDVSISKLEKQPRGVTFIKRYGGGDGEHVQQTTDGGYIIAGDKDALVWLIKTDSIGNIVWDKTFVGDGTDRHYSYCVQQTNDGGYIISGHRYFSQTNEGGAWLIKTDSAGNKEWDRTFGYYKQDEAFYVQQTMDGGYIISGEHINDGIWLIKTDNYGYKEWEKTFGHGVGYCVQLTTDGGYILFGEERLIKTDFNGNKEWDKTFAGCRGYCVQQTTDGGYIITGYIEVSSLNEDVLLIKTDSAGNLEWDKTFGGIPDNDAGYSIQQTTDGGYIITGKSWGFFPSRGGIWLVKTDSDGNKEWDERFIGYKGYCVQQTTDGGYIISGEKGGICLIKTNENGKSKTKAVTGNMLLLRILQRFPLLQKLIRTPGFGLY